MTTYSYIVRVKQRDDLEPVSDEEVARTVAYRLTDGAWLDLVEVVPIDEDGQR